MLEKQKERENRKEGVLWGEKSSYSKGKGLYSLSRRQWRGRYTAEGGHRKKGRKDERSGGGKKNIEPWTNGWDRFREKIRRGGSHQKNGESGLCEGGEGDPFENLEGGGGEGQFTLILGSSARGLGGKR